MISVQGYAAMTEKSALTPFSFERREVGDHDVLIDIHYCGICHSDIHQARNEWGKGLFPMVPGHEITGVVQRVGKSVSRFKQGARVGVGCFVDSCRQCENCQQGLEQYCDEGMTKTYSGIGRDGEITQGGYSSQIVVNEQYVLHIPDNLPLDAAAPLLCAGITLYSALQHWHAGPGKNIAIIGLGGLGHMGVKMAHAMQATVSVLSHSPEKREDSLRLGADHFYTSTDASLFKALANTFDLMICTVSEGIDWNVYLNLLKCDGTMVLIGIPGQRVPVGALSLIGCRRSLAGSLIGGIKETQEMLDFCSQHNMTADIELVPIQQVNEAYERVLQGDVRYRFVMDTRAK